jgi:hypothetical protein
MVAQACTVVFQGIDVLAVDAGVQIAQGPPAFDIVRPTATPFIRSSGDPVQRW